MIFVCCKGARWWSLSHVWLACIILFIFIELNIADRWLAWNSRLREVVHLVFLVFITSFVFCFDFIWVLSYECRYFLRLSLSQRGVWLCLGNLYFNHGVVVSSIQRSLTNRVCPGGFKFKVWPRRCNLSLECIYWLFTLFNCGWKFRRYSWFLKFWDRNLEIPVLLDNFLYSF